MSVAYDSRKAASRAAQQPQFAAIAAAPAHDFCGIGGIINASTASVIVERERLLIGAIAGG
jgi:hypothetical protein